MINFETIEALIGRQSSSRHSEPTTRHSESCLTKRTNELASCVSLSALCSESLTVADCNNCEVAITGQTNIDRSRNQFGMTQSGIRPLFRHSEQTPFRHSELVSESKDNNRKAAFTLAEVLITLGIIGVVAAMTLPTLIQKYKKHEVETRLKQSYSMLGNIVNRAQADYGDIGGWDFTLSLDEFCDLYILPYLQKTMHGEFNKSKNTSQQSKSYKLSLNNGTSWTLVKYHTTNYYFAQITVDINGDKKPNAQGKDQFNFYIFPEKRNIYNSGNGDVAWNVPHAGVYYDGYGVAKSNRNKLFNNEYRGCSKNVIPTDFNAYCIALIAENNWKIPEDYPYKF